MVLNDVLMLYKFVLLPLALQALEMQATPAGLDSLCDSAQLHKSELNVMWIWRMHCFLTALMNTDIGFVQINEDWICFILVSLHYGSMSCIFRVPISTHYWFPVHHRTTISPSPSRTERISKINVQITSIFFVLHYSTMVLYNCLFAVFFPLKRTGKKLFFHH